MGKYSVIAEISEKIAEILAANLVPEILPDRNSIGFCSPEEKGDYSLGIHLYNLEKSNELSYSGMVNKGMREQQYPPQILSLYYMITAYSKSDLRFRAIEEQKILGIAMQTISDNSSIAGSVFGNEALGSDVHIELLDMSYDDKVKIWSDSTKNYKPSIFCKVTPVELESLKKKSIARVKDFSISIDDRTEL